MTRRAQTFHQRDVSRAIRAATAGGMRVGAVRIDPRTGRIEVVAIDATAGPSSTAAGQGDNEWDSI
jgi:hypothetical protein